MHATLQLPQYDHLPQISYRDVRKVLIREIYCGNRKKKTAPKYRCRYEANHVDMNGTPTSIFSTKIRQCAR
jgi:hypothetical protein